MVARLEGGGCVGETEEKEVMRRAFEDFVCLTVGWATHPTLTLCLLMIG